MLRALLTDIHANLEALDACLEHARRQGVQGWALLGDFVGYGADPGPVIDVVMSLVAEGAFAVVGNHDEAVAGSTRPGIIDDAKKVIDWTRSQLTAAQRDFIAGLPLVREDGPRLYVHANAWAPGQWEYLASAADARRSMNATRCRLTFCGHVHDPALYHMGPDGRVAQFRPVPGVAIPLGTTRRWLAVPGSAGQPRDGVPAAAYAILDETRNALTFYRVPYDVERAAAKVRHVGLPEALARRLEHGA